MAKEKQKRPAVELSPERHAEILRTCPEGYKIKAFVDALIQAGLEQMRKGKKK